MRILKKILMWLGGIFILLIVVIGFISLGSSNFKDSQESFVAKFMADISKDWTSTSVRFRLTNEALEQIDSTEGRQVLQEFSLLGEIKAIDDLEIENYVSGTSGKTGTFTFKATFENGDAVVRMTLVERDGKVQVQAINITPAAVGIISAPKDVQI